MTVVSAESTWPRHGHRTSSNLVGHSRAVLVQLARDAVFRARMIGVRVPGTVLMEGEPARAPGSVASGCAGNRSVRVARLPRRMNQPGGWPRLETGWRLMAVGFDFSVLFHLPPVHTGRESCSYPESEPARDCRRRLENGWTCKRRCSSHPLSSLKSMEGAPPARQRALKARPAKAPLA